MADRGPSSQSAQAGRVLSLESSASVLRRSDLPTQVVVANVGNTGDPVPSVSSSGAICSAPASPWQNGYAETIHSRLRDEFLACEVFESLGAARRLTRAWRDDYNHHRPHSSLGYVTPVEFAAPTTASRRCPATAASSLPSPTAQACSLLQQHSGVPLPSSQLVQESVAGHNRSAYPAPSCSVCRGGSAEPPPLRLLSVMGTQIPYHSGRRRTHSGQERRKCSAPPD